MFKLLGNAEPLSTVATPFYIPINSTQSFQFFHILVNTGYFPVFK